MRMPTAQWPDLVTKRQSNHMQMRERSKHQEVSVAVTVSAICYPQAHLALQRQLTPVSSLVSVLLELSLIYAYMCALYF